MKRRNSLIFSTSKFISKLALYLNRHLLMNKWQSMKIPGNPCLSCWCWNQGQYRIMFNPNTSIWHIQYFTEVSVICRGCRRSSGSENGLCNYLVHKLALDHVEDVKTALMEEILFLRLKKLNQFSVLIMDEYIVRSMLKLVALDNAQYGSSTLLVLQCLTIN